MCRWLAVLSKNPTYLRDVLANPPHSIMEMSRKHFNPSIFDHASNVAESCEMKKKRTEIDHKIKEVLRSVQNLSEEETDCDQSNRSTEVSALNLQSRIDSTTVCPRANLLQLLLAMRRNHSINDDGWGVAVCNSEGSSFDLLEKGSDAISVSPKFQQLLESNIKGTCIMAHARAASHGNVELKNCHPFNSEGFTFMHNGGVANFNSIIKAEIIATVGELRASSILGETDTEHCFALFRHIIFQVKESQLKKNDSSSERSRIDEGPELDHHHQNHHQAGVDNPYSSKFSPAEIAAALLETIQWIVKRTSLILGRSRSGSSMNFAVSNGDTMVCSRFRDKVGEEAPSLYYARGSSLDLNICEDNENEVVIVSSEPLVNLESPPSTQRKWHILPNNHLLVVCRETMLQPELIPIEYATQLIAHKLRYNYLAKHRHNNHSESTLSAGGCRPTI